MPKWDATTAWLVVNFKWIVNYFDNRLIDYRNNPRENKSQNVLIPVFFYVYFLVSLLRCDSSLNIFGLWTKKMFTHVIFSTIL